MGGRTFGVAVLAMGGPRRREEVEPFLRSLFADPLMIRLPRALRPFQRPLARLVARRRTPKVAPRYAEIGYSPLVPATERLAASLQEKAVSSGDEALVWAGMRYGTPRTTDVLRASLPHLAARRRDTPVVLLPQYPFYSGATTESALEEAERVVQEHGLRPLRVERFGGHAMFLDLVTAQVRAVLGSDVDPKARVHVLFSAHGLPVSYVRRGDPYEREVRAAFDEVRRRLGDVVPHERVHLAFQSRVGPAEWLRPYTDEVIQELARGGAGSVVMVPFGFTCEHLETLEEMDILYRDLARAAGIRSFHRVPTPGDDPRYLGLQWRLVEEALAPDDAALGPERS